MPVFALPLVQSFCVVEHGRVRPVIWVEIHHPDGITRFRPGRSNLSKLLLIASLWGIHVDSRREETASRELRWAVLDPWMWGAAATLAILVAASCAALFGGGIVDNLVDLAKFFAQTGVWYFYVIGLAVLSAWRLYRYTVQHERRKLNEVLLKREEPEQGITRGAA